MDHLSIILQVLTRELRRFTARLDLFRLLHYYHSGVGYFITSRILSVSIYALVRSRSVGLRPCTPAILERNLKVPPFISSSQVFHSWPLSPPPQSFPILGLDPPPSILSPQTLLQALYLALVSLLGYVLEASAIQLAVQIGLVSTLPYMCQLIVETGLIQATLTFLRQFISGSIIFAIFRMQTTASYFANTMLYGGASYHASGRGFNYGPSSFVQLYSLYSRSHLYTGFELFVLMIVVAATGSAGSRYGEFTWGIWLVSSSYLFAPFW